jgi:hypothetical protein
MSTRLPKWAFEAVFSDFVMEFGGEVLSPIPGSHTADYLFLAHNVIAELKCLQDEQTAEMNSRVEQLV